MTPLQEQEFLGFTGPEEGPGLDRAARLRADPAAQAALWADPAARCIGFVAGDVLMAPEGSAPDPVTGLGLWSVPTAGQEAVPRLFLGLIGAAPVFALDLPAAAAPAAAERADLRWMLPRLCPRASELAATARGLFVWHRFHGFCPACGGATRITHAGWQRDCPGCGRVQFPRTDPVVIMRIIRDDQVLLARSPGWPEGLHSCPAGFMEPGETPAAAVRREVFEETGIRVGAVRFLAAQPWPFPASLMLGCAGAAEPGAITLDPTELEAALWVGRSRLAAVLAGRDPDIRPPRPGTVARWMLRDWLARPAD
ncbi:NAD(+) diphosphatase [Rhodobacter capsulatus]|jgi:NAD+ diphosphatase|uniref:NAD(+) diphosphatase n=1 Tax=Rhodobacter capsulatus (strain ATCC BAA-309 / NBRC 16581 / SB1003) TaxID=272942 RepID=D5AMF8_RHOCB|nr:NAD(+) diphosphatase [Rhodobacter capsulatus]ADE86234.1 NAD(+) diphosphatase [Rhodobacter capsulatus SB 1003]ETD00854.1 NUDIX hydrolase [Rhodobacter capsulatus DE442]ETD75150.1 NUDIX hydrolase [Rhodobacter capsulatus R121]ETD86594.1 NUDIX hydrolase [Rhodobacter capsulatus B6]ETE52890.1 NUDIX hydrolase [Rhodobacter capsulatus Y262]